MASSAAIALHNNKVLFILRDNIPHIHDPNKWELPGGMIEAGETYLDALKREFNEELGIIPQNIKFFGEFVLDGVVRGAVYVVHLNDSEVSQLKLGDEGQRFEFFTFDQLQKLELATVIGYYVKNYGEYVKELMENPAIALDPAKFGLKS